MVEALKAWGVEDTDYTLLILNEMDETLHRSGRNIERLQVCVCVVHVCFMGNVSISSLCVLHLCEQPMCASNPCVHVCCHFPYISTPPCVPTVQHHDWVACV